MGQPPLKILIAYHGRKENFMRRMTNFWAFIKKLAGLIGFTGNKIEVGNDLEVDGDLEVNSSLKAETLTDGTTTKTMTEVLAGGGGGVTLNSIKDSDGNNCFISGDVTINKSPSDVPASISYGRYALTGNILTMKAEVYCPTTLTNANFRLGFDMTSFPSSLKQKIISALQSNLSNTRHNQGYVLVPGATPAYYICNMYYSTSRPNEVSLIVYGNSPTIGVNGCEFHCDLII